MQSASDLTRKIAAADDDDDEPPNLISQIDNNDTSCEDDTERLEGGTIVDLYDMCCQTIEKAPEAHNATPNVANATATPAFGTGLASNSEFC